jgi:hypothetical protein
MELIDLHHIEVSASPEICLACCVAWSVSPDEDYAGANSTAGVLVFF